MEPQEPTEARYRRELKAKHVAEALADPHSPFRSQNRRLVAQFNEAITSDTVIPLKLVAPINEEPSEPYRPEFIPPKTTGAAMAGENQVPPYTPPGLPPHRRRTKKAKVNGPNESV